MSKDKNYKSSLLGAWKCNNLTQSPWIGLHKPSRSPELRLIAFHHAGGNASFFQPWVEHMQRMEWLDFVAIQLPGRGRRLSENPIAEIETLLAILESDLAPLQHIPYVLFGFSMGAILAYELTRRAEERGMREPKALILAGRGAPSRQPATVMRGALSRECIVAELHRMGGTDPELLADEAFLDVFMRMFQADFSIADTHVCSRSGRLRCPVHAWGGVDDPEVSVEHIYRWRTLAGATFSGQMFAGDHFFLRSSQLAVLENLDRILNTVRNSLSVERTLGRTLK